MDKDSEPLTEVNLPKLTAGAVSKERPAMVTDPMPAVPDQRAAPVVLDERKHEDILMSQILPLWTGDAVRQDAPVVVLVAGPPGSGKTTMCELLKLVLDRRGGAVVIGRDLYKSHHPAYEGLLCADDRTAGARVRPNVLRWQAAVEEFVREHRFDAVLETPGAAPDEIRTRAGAWRAAGYRVEVVVLAAAEAVTQLSVLDRYVTQAAASGAGHYVAWDNHDACVRGLPRDVEIVEAEALADRLMVVRRDLTVLYDREPGGDGTAPGLPRGRQVLVRERSRPWTAPETWRFRRQAAALEQRLHPSLLAPEQRLAVTAGVERALALSEPVRRRAQVRPGRLGVDYHRLSEDEHRFIFEELIVPGYLSRFVPQKQPIVTYVLAQPGAGKSEVSRLIRRSMRVRRPVRITSEDFRAHHPDYRMLLQDDPRLAGARMRADYQAWMRQAEDYVRARRGDLIIEMAPEHPEIFLDSVARSHRAGCRIEVVLLGVREADSRQGAAHRYSALMAEQLPARFTTQAGHDRVYEAVADCAALLEEHPGIDSVMVLRRDQRPVFHNTRTPKGAWRHAPRGLAALTVLRGRLYTEQEAAVFLSTQAWLRQVLPQHQDELADITALARPLMPARMQPPRLEASSAAGAGRGALPVRV